MAYYAIFTTLGLQRLAEAQAAYEPLVFTHVAVGDGDGAEITPSVGMTELVNETARVTVNSTDLSPDSPNTVRVEGLIPAATGGFTIREAGLFNADGELIAVASYPPIYKPEPSEGVSVEEYIRILLEYEAIEAIALSSDPDVIIATRLYVDGLVYPSYFMDGSDGDIELDGGESPYSFITGSGPDYALARDVFINNLTLSDGVTLDTNGFRYYVRGTAFVPATARIHHDGSDSAGTAGGAGATAGSLVGGGDGGAGGGAGSAPGVAGTDVDASGGGDGGAGGGSGGAAGGAATDDAEHGSIRSMLAALYGYRFGSGDTYPIAGGAGGGGGGSVGGGTGSGGGGGGGVSCWAIRNLILEGEISCNGGAGAAGSGGAGGGGGGGGGYVGGVYGSKTGGGSITATGGAAGAGSGGAAAAGSEGEVVLYDLGLPVVEDSTLMHYESGVAIFDSEDEVEVEFPDSWAYDTATGASGYELDVSVPYVPAGTDIRVVISEKTTTGFTLKSSASFTGEVRWKTKGI